MKYFFYILVFALIISCESEKDRQLEKDVRVFLDEYNKKYAELYTVSSKAEWISNTKIVEGDTLNAYNSQQAGKALAKYTGSKEVIEKTKKFLSQKDKLDIVKVRQLNAILYNAANNPYNVEKVVNEKIKQETVQTEKLFGYDYKVNNKSVSTGEIDSILNSSTDLEERLAYWNSSKEVGKVLKNGLDTLRILRNQTVKGLGYNNFFAYQVSEYGYDSKEMREILQKTLKDIWPLYRELHTWARYELAAKYHQPVPDYLPAHWLPNRWGQDWTSLVKIEGIDIDKQLQTKTKEWMVKEGENFYKSLGFPALPASFYTNSSLYPVPANAGYKKNNHASAWHIDLNKQVQCLMSVENTAEYYETIHHEFGHIYYFLEYSNPDTPIVLRNGANRGFHEAVGSLMGLASLQKPFLVGRGMVDKNVKTDEMHSLLKESLNYVVFMPFSCGVMTDFEQQVYENNLPADQFNAKWWELTKKYQGIIPPNERGSEYCDAASKTHIINDAAQYYDYPISNVLLFQFHNHIAKHILKQDVHATNYYGSKETGDFIKKLLHPGKNCDWQELLRENVGGEMSAKPMLNYFEPLLQYLKEKNKGRKYTLAESL